MSVEKAFEIAEKNAIADPDYQYVVVVSPVSNKAFIEVQDENGDVVGCL